MIKVSHAILHAFDFGVGSLGLSEGELDLSEKPIKSYVTRACRHVSASPDSRHGEFADASDFASEFGRYVAGQRDFIDLSQDIARYFYEELIKCEDVGQCDLLVADFVDTATDMTASASSAAGQDMAAALDEAYESEGRRQFAIILLQRRQAFAHDVRTWDGKTYNDIVRHDGTLPNPSQKVDTYAVIDADTLAIDFHDVERSYQGQPTMLVPELFLKCSTQVSSREVIQTVTQLVEDVAEEYGIEPAIAAAQAKNYVIEKTRAADVVTPEEVGREVFAERAPQAAERYEEAVKNERLPESVSVKTGVANRIAKNHRIRTDTGIEITFPSEYAASDDFIAFSRDDAGKIIIEVRNVASIENRS